MVPASLDPLSQATKMHYEVASGEANNASATATISIAVTGVLNK